MNKFKKILLGTLTVLTLGVFVAVGTNVEAKTVDDYGSVAVTTTTNSGDTKTWKFNENTPSSNVSMANGDTALGILTCVGNTTIQITSSNGFDAKTDSANALNFDGIDDIKADSNKTVAKGGIADKSVISKTASNLTGINGSEIYIPVPSGSEGTIYIWWISNDSRRGLLFDGSSSNYTYLRSNKTEPGVSITFTSSDIVSNPTIASQSYTGDYLKFINVAVDGTSKENKIGQFKVVLSSGSFGEAATLHTVTYMDGTTTLKSDTEAVDGSSITYTPKKYGYDFEGWYTDSTLTSESKIDTSYTVTGDATLYANWTAWTNTGIEEYTLSNAAIEKIETGIDGNLSADLALTPSIYTAMSGVGMTTTNVTLPGASSAAQSACFNTNGALTTSQCGIKFTAPSNGTLTLWAGSGSTEERTIKVTDGNTELTPTSGSVTVPSSYAPHEIVFDVNGNTTYYVGGNKGVRIYYISFEAIELADGTTASVFAEKNTAGDTLRFVGTMTGINDLADIQTIELILTLNGDATEEQIFLTKCYTEVTGASQTCDPADGTYYVIFRITGVSGLTGTITKQLKITFTDGSTTLSAVDEINL